ncbi:hypothetical protein AgCh_021927 [Apium graveolens]
MAARCWKRRKSAELRTLLSILLSVRLTMTSSDETVYELFVPVDKPEVLPQAISILAEFSSEIRVSSDDLEKERGAVLEEYRGTRNANGRMQEAHWALMMEGSKELEGIPGNLGWPVVGESSSFLSEFSSPQGIYSFIKNRQKRYGKVFKSYVLGKYIIFMTGRDACKILLTGKDGLVTLNLFYTGKQARDRMYAMFDSIISKRRSGKSVHQDFLESLIQKHTKNDWGEDQDDKLMDKQLKDNILTLLIAGHDTTTTALTWLIKFIVENPDVLERLRKEHTEILDNRKTGSSLTWSEVTNMPYTTKVISETIRMATILPWYSRKAAQDFQIT